MVGFSPVQAAAAQAEDLPVCWICLDGPSIDRPLMHPCRCPSFVHSTCIARWQLQSAGTRWVASPQLLRSDPGSWGPCGSMSAAAAGWGGPGRQDRTRADNAAARSACLLSAVCSAAAPGIVASGTSNAGIRCCCAAHAPAAHSVGSFEVALGPVHSPRTLAKSSSSNSNSVGCKPQL